MTINLNLSTMLGLFPRYLFDSAWYTQRYPDVNASKLGAFQHFKKHGALEGRDPHPLFDSRWYSNEHGGLIEKKINPLEHFVRNRESADLDPHPLFSTRWYRSQLSKQGKRTRLRLDALSHFVDKGWKLGLNPHPLFDVRYYCAQLKDCRELNTDPLSHYLTVGWRRGLRPSEIFDPSWYLERYKDVSDADVEPLTHYVRIGWLEDRRPIPMFSPDAYRRTYGLGADANPLVDYVASARESLPAKGQINGSASYVKIHLPKARVLDLAKPVGIFLHINSDVNVHKYVSYLSRIDIPMSIHVTTSSHSSKRRITKFFCKFDRVNITVVPDRGGALASLLVTHKAEILEHHVCLMIGEAEDGIGSAQAENSRRILLENLLGTPTRVKSIVKAFLNDAALGIAVNAPDRVRSDDTESEAAMQEVVRLAALLGLTGAIRSPLGVSSMPAFWFRPQALSLLLAQNFEWSDFAEGAQAQCARSKAIEYVIPILCEKENRRCGIVPGLWDSYQLTYDGMRRLIEQNHAFDADYYLREYADIAEAGIDPLKHWIETGVKEGRNPSAWFKTGYYMRVIRANWAESCNPLVHYLLEGKAQGLPTAPPEKTKASIEIDDLYSHFTKTVTHPEHVPETHPIIRQTDIKLIAFYLPQFHPFAENDKFWGRGFTEWTNTSKALPLFKGHYQPRFPGELGFYDLRLKPVLARQIELAKQYGVHGWCLHHYFFEGKPLMRAVYDALLQNPDLDIPFCLHWANEPWTVRFDGLSSKTGTLIEQKHSADDDLAFFRDVSAALCDPRYIRIDGRPLLIIYRPALFPDIKATVARWRECCEKLGIERLFLAAMQTSFEGGAEDPREYGFDAAIEFPPHNYHLSDVGHRVDLYDPGSSMGVYDYEHLARDAIARPETPYRLFRGIMPEWDNSPRRANCGAYVNCAPHRYRRWLEALCQRTDDNRQPDEKLIFINAWNEWAEGAYLEPDRKYGYAYLNATAKALNTYRAVSVDRLNLKILVAAHVFYLDLLDELIAYFKNVPGRFDILVSTPKENAAFVANYIRERMPSRVGTLDVVGVENIGFDFAPFLLQALPRSLGYDVCCKIHLKKTPYNSSLAGWREYLLDNLLGSSENIAAIFEAFKHDPELGLLYAAPYGPVANHLNWGSNYAIASPLLKKLDIESNGEEIVDFPAGSMFWFRPQALAPLLKLNLKIDDFYGNEETPRAGTAIIDGTMAHALERMVGYVVRSAGYRAHQGVFMS